MSFDFDFKKVFSGVAKAAPELAKKVVGIDFGASSIKVVEVEKIEGVLSLSTYGELQLGPYLEQGIGSTVKLPLKKRVEALVDILRESGVTAKQGVMALSLAESFVTIISLSAKPDEDIGPKVQVEARKYIPVPIIDVSLEWSELPNADQKALSREVLLVAIQNDALKEINALAESIIMTQRHSELELFSTLRAITKETDTSVAVFDIGAKTSKCYVAEGGFLRRIHRVQTGGSFVTSALAKEKNISFESAEELKHMYIADTADGLLINKIMLATFERVFQEFKRVLHQYELRTGSPVGRIVLTGGVVSFPEFQAFASYMLDREVEITNPFAKIAYPAYMEDTLVSIAPLFTVALGAALQSFETE